MIIRLRHAVFDFEPILIRSLKAGQTRYLNLTTPFNTIVGRFLFGSSPRPRVRRARPPTGFEAFPCPSAPWALSDPDGKSATNFGLYFAVDQAPGFVELGPLAGGWGF